MADNNGKDNFTALDQLLGYNSAAVPSPTKDVLDEVMKDLTEERKKQAKEQAARVLREAINLRTQFQQAERQFNSQRAKFNKELGKLLGTLKRAMRGEPPVEEPGEDQAQA